MKTRCTPEEQQILKSIYGKNPNGVLAIECEFYELVKEYFTIDLVEVCTGRVSNDSVVEESLKLVRQVGELANNDLLNMQKCIAFVKTNYPHALFSIEEFMISLNNLSPDEIKHCLAQEDMNFVYYEAPEE